MISRYDGTLNDTKLHVHSYVYESRLRNKFYFHKKATLKPIVDSDFEKSIRLLDKS